MSSRDPSVVLQLSPDITRLEVVGHSMAAIASLPRRLLNPPPRFPRLNLSDVLAGRHCSPISLIDFEHYLAYTEHSIENLYFTMWLQAYTNEYARLDHSDVSTATQLSHSFLSAARTYVAQDAPYELNLTAQNRAELLALPTMPPPPPSACEAARRETQSLLEDSFRRWEKRAKSNAGWRRLAFGMYLGLVNACLAVTAMIVVRIYVRGTPGRILAVCLTPWLWFSLAAIICSLKGICFFCFSVGGTVRQVSSFELSLPRIHPNIYSITTVVPSTSTTATTIPPPSPVGAGSAKTVISDDTTISANGSSLYDKLGWEYTTAHLNANSDDPFSPHSLRCPEFVITRHTMAASHHHHHHHRDHHHYHYHHHRHLLPRFHSHALPRPGARSRHSLCSGLSKAIIVKFWAPMVKVEDPLIARAYWETVVKGFFWALLLAVLIGCVAAAA